MENSNTNDAVASKRRIAKQCLYLVRDIVTRAAASGDPETIGYALAELSQVFFERTGSEEPYFKFVAAEGIDDLEKLREELTWVADSCGELVAISAAQRDCDIGPLEKPASDIRC